MKNKERPAACSSVTAADEQTGPRDVE